MTGADDDLARLWEWFGAHQFRGYAPIYDSIATAVAGDRALLDLVRAAPPEAHLPPALLGAVHYLLLDGVDHPLGEVYAGRSGAAPAPLFLDLCHTYPDELSALLAVRRVQTNDCGRSALLGPGLTWIASRMPGPYALVDVGASAGLTLLCDEYRLDYGDVGATGPPDSPVVATCHIRGGHPPIADRLPELADRVGIDRSPLDLTDPDDARWLLACVWPGTGRYDRTAASIRLALRQPPTVLAGDADQLLASVLGGLDEGLTALVVTSWVVTYFSLDERRRFVELLAEASCTRPVAWLSADGAGTVAPLGDPTLTDRDGAHAHVLGAALFDEGEVGYHRLATVQQHGGWMDWHADAC